MSTPSNLAAEIGRAEQAIANGRRAEAVAIYHEARDRVGDDAGMQFLLGRLVFNIGDADQAAEHFQAAVDGNPDNNDYRNALGLALQRGGFLDRAMAVFNDVLASRPDSPDALEGIGTIFLQRDKPEVASDFLERAAKLKPGNVALLVNLSNALCSVERHDDAIRFAKKAIKLDESDAGAHYALCRALTESGRMDETKQHLRQTIRRHRLFGPAYDLLARIHTFTDADDDIVKNGEKALEGSMPPMHRYSLHYALGKMHADRADYDRSFRHYEKANTLQDAGFDLKRDTKLVRELRQVFDAKSLAEYAGFGNDSRQPVFIVGMPRSGTTLLEQIIAAHPEAAGAGELSVIGGIAEKIFPERDTRSVRAQAAENLTAERCREHAETYLTALNFGRGDAARIVDKMPSNFLFLGLIVTLFPNATIIHAIRHPLDIALSCYVQNFKSLHWTNSFENIAGFYRLYRETMEFWDRQLPAGKIVPMVYERLVDDPEGEARRLIEACELEWDPAVLDFSRRKGVVRTASLAQVRQPVYKTSQRNWIRYGKHVEPLARRLAPWIEEDRQLLAEHGIDLGSKGLFGRLFG